MSTRSHWRRAAADEVVVAARESSISGVEFARVAESLESLLRSRSIVEQAMEQMLAFASLRLVPNNKLAEVWVFLAPARRDEMNLFKCKLLQSVSHLFWSRSILLLFFLIRDRIIINRGHLHVARHV